MGESWVAGHLTTILRGHAARAATEISTQADQTGLRGTRREGADACVSSLTGHLALRYDTAFTAGWPIATGPIEGACRNLIGDRLDTTGSRWGMDGAEAVLKPHALIDNGDFDAYGERSHLAREHQRLYPTPDQHNYELTGLITNIPAEGATPEPNALWRWSCGAPATIYDAGGSCYGRCCALRCHFHGRQRSPLAELAPVLSGKCWPRVSMK
ncbi:hypothetical protein [Wenjunlia tyrosinilytica]|uniref:Uncharacterized protein n=1 Tax=Wenjunlia tyrosinilytica TaxID=1544741 RepID=A0A918E197_9ACTN|nr:hypothetical protein GCM10012280_66590 [Wenjunlia tyrosinilytica]